jgi:6-phosphogluconate dehydrogenase
MQLISESYHLMKVGLGMSNEEMHRTFAEWNEGELDSYFIEITRDILDTRDEEGRSVLDLILDTAGQKGTGKWTVVSAANLGMPLGRPLPGGIVAASSQNRYATPAVKLQRLNPRSLVSSTGVSSCRNSTSPGR